MTAKMAAWVKKNKFKNEYSVTVCLQKTDLYNNNLTSPIYNIH